MTLPASPGAPDEGAVEMLLRTAVLDVEGALPDASNLTARVLLTGDDGRPTGERAIYKPVRGETPLRDFPSGTLGHREVAAYEVSAAGGWDLIPCTVWREGPLGPGSVQRWVDWETAGRPPGDGLLELFAGRAAPEGWLPVVRGEDAEGDPVTVAHRDSASLASLAVLDLVLNNADRKGAHLLRDAAGRVWGVDHGLTLHAEDKLRTVLWGWAGRPLPPGDVARLERTRTALTPRHTVSSLVAEEEFEALLDRIGALIARPVFPEPPQDRYPLPWPLW